MSPPNPNAPIYIVISTLRVFTPTTHLASIQTSFTRTRIGNQAISHRETQRTSTVCKAFYRMERANVAGQDSYNSYKGANGTQVGWDGSDVREDGTWWFAVVLRDGREVFEVEVVRSTVDERRLG